jgi:hypothetical protein
MRITDVFPEIQKFTMERQSNTVHLFDFIYRIDFSIPTNGLTSDYHSFYNYVLSFISVSEEIKERVVYN